MVSCHVFALLVIFFDKGYCHVEGTIRMISDLSVSYQETLKQILQLV